MHKLKYTHRCLIVWLSMLGDCKIKGFPWWKQCRSLQSLCLMFSDELSPEPQGGLEHIFFYTVMFHKVWVVAIFFFLQTLMAVLHHIFLLIWERWWKGNMELEWVALLPCYKKFTRGIFWSHFGLVTELVPQNTSWELCSNNSFKACVSEKDTHE